MFFLFTKETKVKLSSWTWSRSLYVYEIPFNYFQDRYFLLYLATENCTQETDHNQASFTLPNSITKQMPRKIECGTKMHF